MINMPDCMYDYRYGQPPAQIVDKCDFCGSNIYEGEEYYDFNDDICCKFCADEYVEHYKKVGEREWQQKRNLKMK